MIRGLAMPAAASVQEATESCFPERVRATFNERAEGWNRKYSPGGRLLWRLDEFCVALTRCVEPATEVLDLGCGTGHLADHLNQRHYRVTGCDIAERMISNARRNFGNETINWVTVPAAWTRLPFPDGTFAAVVASSVFEYLADVELAFMEIARVLSDRGILIFNVPNPGNFRRRREDWSERLTKQRWIRRSVCVIPRARRYLGYLDLSKNRYALQKWEHIALRHGLLPLGNRSQRPHRRPLYLFTLRKGASEDAVKSKPPPRAP